MPDVVSRAPADVRTLVALDVHKLSIAAATLPPTGGQPEIHRAETTEKAIRRFVARLGGPEGLAVCYEAGPGGFALWRLLSSIGVACDVIAPSLIPVRADDRVKTDRREAQKLVTLYCGGLLRFVAPPTPETRGCETCCVAVMTSGALGPRPVTGWPSSCCATGTSSARARRRGRSSTRRGSDASSSPTRSPRRRWCRC